MKPIRIFLLLACMLFSLTAAASAAMPDISADKTKFDPLTMTYELTGNVRVATSDRVITADHAGRYSIQGREALCQRQRA